MKDSDEVLAYQDVITALYLIRQSSTFIYSEVASMKLQQAAFEAFCSPEARRQIRRSSFRLQGDLEQMLQHLDALNYALSDFEFYDGEYTDHGFADKLKGAF
jgi:hypothetical protein